MKNLLITFILLLFFIGCGGGGEEIPTSNPIIEQNSSDDASSTISGKITYERIQPLHSGSGTVLDRSNITNESAKQVIVSLVDDSGSEIALTVTDDNGEYIFTNVAKDSNLKVRVYAKMFKTNRWEVKVIDNTNSDALYAIEGDMSTNRGTRNLLASSSNSQAAPFAILDSIYLAMKKVIAVDSSAVFPLLKVNWSTKNIITGTYYNGVDTIMMQGDQKGDSDEYDNHVIIHEWGHFFESKFSRADSIGGSHGSGDHLDIRLAFGEGWGNAWSAIATDDPIYFDTIGSNGWNMNIETATHDTPGWFSEASIQRILYDLYDSHNEGEDNLGLGFKPIYDTLTGAQKETKAFTSLFSFITALKNENLSSANKIDDIVSSEDIDIIDNIYGANRRNDNVNTKVLPIYKELSVGNSVNVCTINDYGVTNKLGIHRYVFFSLASRDNYTIVVEKSDSVSSDPDFTLFKMGTSPTKQIAESTSSGRESRTLNLLSGDYILDIVDANSKSSACFDVSIN